MPKLKCQLNDKKENFKLNWPELISGTLVKRYKRFLADVKLENDNIVTAHCPNSGRMTECCMAGQPVYLSKHDSPTRKYPYTWELIEMPDSLVGVNTNVPNALVFESIKHNDIPELQNYTDHFREVSTGNHSRIDILLKKKGHQPCYVEVKNCTLVKNRLASFPDAVTRRGRKHLKELQTLKKEGNRCVMFYLIQRMDADTFTPAESIDPDYACELKAAAANGVEILAYDVIIDLKTIHINRKLPYQL